MTNTVEEVATNAVAAFTQTATEAKEILTGTMGQQVEQGKELLQQIVTWLTHDGVALGVRRNLLELARILERIHITRQDHRVVRLADLRLAAADDGRRVTAKTVKSLDPDLGHFRGAGNRSPKRSKRNKSFHRRHFITFRPQTGKKQVGKMLW